MGEGFGHVPFGGAVTSLARCTSTKSFYKRAMLKAAKASKRSKSLAQHRETEAESARASVEGAVGSRTGAQKLEEAASKQLLIKRSHQEAGAKAASEAYAKKVDKAEEKILEIEETCDALKKKQDALKKSKCEERKKKWASKQALKKKEG